jgi:GNAT superfamily N-acetyltransferase
MTFDGLSLCAGLEPKHRVDKLKTIETTPRRPVLTLSIRFATADDLPLIAQFIRDLAAYEKLAHEVRFDEAGLGQRLFGPRPYAEVLIGEIDGIAQGFALFFHNFSTFEGKPGIYLEDLFVRPEARGSGLGKALLKRLAALAIERDCARLEWWVLDWNAPSIGFYKALGAKPMDEWTVFRVDGDALTGLADAG